MKLKSYKNPRKALKHVIKRAEKLYEEQPSLVLDMNIWSMCIIGATEIMDDWFETTDKEYPTDKKFEKWLLKKFFGFDVKYDRNTHYFSAYNAEIIFKGIDHTVISLFTSEVAHKFGNDEYTSEIELKVWIKQAKKVLKKIK